MQNSTVNNLWKTTFFRVISILIIIGVFFTTTQVARTVVQRLLHSPQNNFLVVSNLIYPCQPFDIQESDQMYVIRLDDVQALAWTNINTKILTDTFEKGFPVVVGVIPKNLSKDKRLTSFLKKNICHIEIAMHGWDHGLSDSDDYLGIAEFETLTREETLERINKSKAVLKKITQVPIITFIPPQNRTSTSALETLVEEGISIVSSEGTGFYDYTVATWDFDRDTSVTFVEMITACDKRFAVTNLCVIMVHPQDFLKSDMHTIDPLKYLEYTKLLEYLSLTEATVVTFHHVAAP